jgi:release factor glutamine methyltransferase
MKLAELISNAADDMTRAGVAEPAREASSLVMLAIGRDRAFLAAHPEYEPSTAELETLTNYIARRAAREPFQYISGMQEFYGLEIEVSPDVLIPRPETEILVERAISFLRSIDSPRFLEVGTGSGCISVSVLAALRDASGISVDVLPNALMIAARNAHRHNVSDRLELILSSGYGSIDEELFDAILSNPPYVPREEIASLQAEVRDHEPHIALDGGIDGLDIVRRLIDESPSHLKPNGLLMIEIGYEQSETVLPLFDADLWKPATAINDLQGIPRCVVAELR